MIIEYKNEPLTDFTIPENREAMEKALRKVENQKGLKYPLIIGGSRIDTEEKIKSVNPSNYNEVLGYVSSAGEDNAEKAVKSALEAFSTWQYVKPHVRAGYLFKAASVLRARKHEFSAWLIEEAGKTWIEADADTAEAIDFLEYYGRQMLKYEKGMGTVQIPGEMNECFYIPLGVGVIIAPWNFPLAILTGMTAAAIVTGNTAIIKPAEPTPIIAAKFMELWDEVCLPHGVINFLPGPGRVVGNYLVSHPDVRFINFTGSKEVGLGINKTASQAAPGLKWIKRVTAEMGGKNAIIVDSEADLDDAAEGIIRSAFGFQGQKCSACSRAVILESVYDEMVEKLQEGVKKLKVGPAKDPLSDIGPVINEKAYKTIMDYIRIGKSEGKLLSGGEGSMDEGYFISPTIFCDVPNDSRIAQEEIFGPVLAVIKAKSYDEAIEIANSTEYGLTGSVYTNNRQKIEKAKERFHVGNLYINKKSTGALVGVHPFGGFNMSGTDSKAGGGDYLQLFMQIKTVSEKL